MLILYKNECVNLNQVNDFSYREKYLIFMNRRLNSCCIDLEDDDRAKKAFERIIDYYRWQRNVCDLNDLAEE